MFLREKDLHMRLLPEKAYPLLFWGCTRIILYSSLDFRQNENNSFWKEQDFHVCAELGVA
jgi:hypothetical protein